MKSRKYWMSATISTALLTLGSLHAAPVTKASSAPTTIMAARAAYAGLRTDGVSAQGKPVAGSATKARGFYVQSLLTTTKAAFEAWRKSTSTAAPRATTRFPAGASEVGYYVEYTGAAPKVTAFRVNIYNQDGSIAVRGVLHTLRYADGSFGNYFYEQPSFPNGTYHMSVLYQNRPVRTTTFTVGS